MERNVRNWTVIYDNGHESVHMTGDDNGNLYCAHCDWEGELESLIWNASASTSEIYKWLDGHHIDSHTYSCGENTRAWEKILVKYKNATVSKLVNGVRKSNQFAL